MAYAHFAPSYAIRAELIGSHYSHRRHACKQASVRNFVTSKHYILDQPLQQDCIRPMKPSQNPSLRPSQASNATRPQISCPLKETRSAQVFLVACICRPA